MSLVVDASIAIKWAVDEGDRARARARVEGSEALIAPEFVLVEVANILWKKVAQREISKDQALTGLPGIRATFSRLVPNSLVLDRALALGLEVKHPVYDCLYLATAELEACRLITADARLLSKLAETPYAARAIDFRGSR